MKMLLISLLTASTLTSIGCSQRINISGLPSVVQNGLKSKFPAAVNMEWEKKGNQFEAEFEVEGKEYTALVDATGQVLMHKQDITSGELPEAISVVIKRDFQAYQLDDLEKVEKGGQVLYQVELENNNQDLKKVYALDGTLSPASYWD